ncbi:tRNA (cmo5U34)-methyltransferase [Orenia metallireducens]|jgi:tRNA (cmo5U34)-methyltransferase|uniref:tRNA (Cmo5U34)-methyltransferase n=1 Tax=Orenia metallireducens TaxID=1413210 RepID=A0A285HRM8_9FIRM|nr:class I SAM-dependent methyltransferase [Orenia metallireducens]PRX25127.1 tRNA (cmo5U34)-methyltransferase [Orenia metallireducens]SNY38382.1 tRNA (cmo5U34)-methyltransferase [Orenia metallireducens]
MKMTVNEIRSRFDNEVDRFSNLETGQTSTVDSALVLEMIANTIAKTNPNANYICDIGCGGGNFTLKVLENFPTLESTIIDLSMNMLNRAKERIESTGGTVEQLLQGDIRELKLCKQHYDIVIAAAVLHHLRNRAEWNKVLKKIYDSLVEGGTFWYWDLIKHEIPKVDDIQNDRYKEYLIQFKGEKYQQHVFDYIKKEDTPETVTFIISELQKVGFKKVDILHKNSKFAAIVAVK